MLGRIALAVLASMLLSPPSVVAQQPTPGVAVFTLSGAINEGPGGGDLLSLFSGGGGGTTLRTLVERIERAATDKTIVGVAIVLDGAAMGSAQLEELVAAIDRVRAAKKPVLFLAESLGTGGYVLASHASHISIVPGGEVSLMGLSSETPYIRGLLDLLGIQPDFLTCGDFKSAGEMFMRTGPSPNSAAMSDWLLDSQFESYVALIARGRGTDARNVRKWIDRGPYTADRARKRKLIEAVEHRREFYARVRKIRGADTGDVRLLTRYGQPPQRKIDLSSPFGLIQFYSQLLQGPAKVASRKNSVAVVYLRGTIVSGSMPFSPLGGGVVSGSAMRKTLEAVENDDTIKAVVLRVDSPGGSALASEVILDAVRRVTARKPLIVSMGNVAASGGYYVACRAHTIFADATTITGSIGVVSGKFATTGLWDKLGIKWSHRQRGKNAGLLGSARIFTEEERKTVQGMMDEIYGQFLGHVKEGRGKKLARPLEEITGGRVYTGRQALELGLVDRLGGLAEAVRFAAERGGLKDYQVRPFPESQGLLDMLLGGGRNADTGPQVVRGGVRLLERVVPLIDTLEPHRAAAIRRVVGQLELLQHERVLLLGPEILIHDGR